MRLPKASVTREKSAINKSRIISDLTDHLRTVIEHDINDAVTDGKFEVKTLVPFDLTKEFLEKTVILELKNLDYFVEFEEGRIDQRSCRHKHQLIIKW